MDELAKEVEKVLNQFLQEEVGNRLSQFSMKSLHDIIVGMIKNYEPKKVGVKEDAKK